MARRRSFCSAGMRRLSTAFWMALLWVHSSRAPEAMTASAAADCFASASAKYQARIMFT